MRTKMRTTTHSTERVALTLAFLMLTVAPAALAQDKSSKDWPVEDILNWRQIDERLYTAGQPKLEHMDALRELGIDTIVSLATPSEEKNGLEAMRAAELGMSFVSIPFGDDGPTPDDVEWFNGVMKAQEGKTVLVHCNTNRRAGVFTFLYRVLVEGVDPEQAMEDVKTVFDPEQSATWSRLIEQMLPAERGAVIVQPGAPGSDITIIESADDLALGSRVYTEADVAFMQGMIHHHAQAVEMVDLIESRSTARDLIMLGKRIEVSQQSEIKMMANWLRERGEDVPAMADPAYLASMSYSRMDHATHAAHMQEMSHGSGETMMPGMLSPEQMQQLRDSNGTEFYRLWVTFMIQHHEGALTMVEHLFTQPGAAQDQDIFHFASEVDIDQRIEILRMRQMLEKVAVD